MVVVAFISDPKVVRRILDHLKLPSMPPPVAASRLTAAGELLSDAPVYDGADPEWRETETDIDLQGARGPP
jgi:hypothetical protein